MTVRRLLFRLLPALFAMLFVAATPAAAWLDHAAAVELLETVPQSTAPAQPSVDHASKNKLRQSPALEEFFEIDDDAEQYFKPPPGLAHHGAAGVPIEARPVAVFHRCTPRTHRACAAYPTGPPHA